MENIYPRLHFTAKYGWINDPNGCVYHDGIYELYFQHNPDGPQWANMTWGHASSTDLLHWEEKKPALFPDENGDMWSGSGIVNSKSLLGLPKDALIFFYTANGAFKKPFEIYEAFSIDGGETLEKLPEKILAEPSRNKRDPKVFWHEESGAYVLVLWLEGNDFGIFRSKDLTHFELASRVTLESGYECPDLFCLPVEGSEEKKWVFWAADGSYYVGDFDGYSFRQTETRRRAYEGAVNLPYAAQTFSGDPKGRILSIAWLRTSSIERTTTGAMSLVRALSLVKGPFGYQLKMALPEEVLDQKGEGKTLSSSGNSSSSFKLDEDGAIFADLHHDGAFSLVIRTENGDVTISLEKDERTLSLTGGIVTDFIGVGRMKVPEEFSVIYDRGILEISWNGQTGLSINDLPYFRKSRVTEILFSSEKEARAEIFVLN